MGELDVLTGQKIERWTVLERDMSKPKGSAFWICRCDCGVIKSIRGNSLRKKKCLTHPKCPFNTSQREDLTGKKFGRLTVIRFDRTDQCKKVRWLCKCDCGEMRSVVAQQLTSGHTKSCGCYRYEMAMQRNSERKPIGNEYEIKDGIVYVTLRNGKTMLCDIDDWEEQKKFTWRENDRGYAYKTRNKGDRMRDAMFHNRIMGEKDGMYVDHINRNKLDNRRCNLRFVTPQVNIINRDILRNNTSGCTGVVRQPNGKWHATITVNRKVIGLGAYEDINDAIKARKEAEEKYFKPLLEVKP